MRLKRAFAAALACAAAAGATGAFAQTAPAPGPAPAAPRQVEVTARSADAPPAATPPAPAAEPNQSAPQPPAPGRPDPAVRLEIGNGQISGGFRVGDPGRSNAQGQFRFAQAAPAGAPGAAPVPGPSPDDRRAIELYRAHFGGQLTKASYLGVSTSPVPGALRQHLSLQEGVGLVVDFVEPDSPAAAAGVKQYDILKKFNDQILVNAQQLAVLVRAEKPGAEVKLGVVRGAKDQTVTAKLVEKEVKPIDEVVFWNGQGGEVKFDVSTFVEDEADVAKVRERLRQRRLADPDNRTRATPGPGGAAETRSSSRTMSVWRDADTTLTIVRNGEGGRQLIAKEKDRHTIFDLDDPESRAKIPPHLEKKVREMEAQTAPRGRVNFNSATVTAEVDVRHEKSADSDDRKEEDNDNDNENENDDDGDKDDGDEEEDAEDSDAAAAIGRDDVLSIRLSEVHGPGVKTEKTARVRDGRVHLPYVAPMKAEGLTAAQLEKQIVAVYTDGKIARNVNVSVKKLKAPKPEEAQRP